MIRLEEADRIVRPVNAYAATPEAFPALVLNADFRPLSYYPLSLWSWQESVKAVFLERVNIVSEYDRFVRSPSFEMRLPSVVSLKTYVKPALYPAFTRFNVFLRDRFMCQYCGCKDDLTFDHLIPRSRGGQTRWDNVVTACAPCNLSKGGHLPHHAGMQPRQHALPADGVRAAPQRAAVPAQLPARQLARLPLLGHRAGAVNGAVASPCLRCRDADEDGWGVALQAVQLARRQRHGLREALDAREIGDVMLVEQEQARNGGSRRRRLREVSAQTLLDVLGRRCAASKARTSAWLRCTRIAPSRSTARTPPQALRRPSDRCAARRFGGEIERRGGKPHRTARRWRAPRAR